MDMFSALCWLCPTCCGVEYRSENSKEQGSFMTFFFFFFSPFFPLMALLVKFGASDTAPSIVLTDYPNQASLFLVLPATRGHHRGPIEIYRGEGSTLKPRRVTCTCFSRLPYSQDGSPTQFLFGISRYIFGLEGFF